MFHLILKLQNGKILTLLSIL